MAKTQKNRRTTHVIHKYQLKFSFFTTAIVFLCSIVYPVIISNYLDALMSLLGENSPLRESFLEKKSELLFWMICFELLIVIITFYLTLKHSLKTVGPVIKTINVLEKLTQGVPVEPVKFRRGDNFQELSDYINSLIDSQSKFESTLRGNLESAVTTLSKVQQRDNMSEDEKRELITKTLDGLREINSMLIK